MADAASRHMTELAEYKADMQKKMDEVSDQLLNLQADNLALQAQIYNLNQRT